MNQNREKTPETLSEGLSEGKLLARQQRVAMVVQETQDSLEYAKELLARAEHVRQTCSLMMFGKVDPQEMINSAPVAMRQEVYDMLRPYCSEADLAPLNVDCGAPDVIANKPLADRLRTKPLV